MPAKIYTAGQLRDIARPNDEANLFRAADGRYWLNTVHKDHPQTLTAEVHEHEADVYLAVAGEADLYLGGSVRNQTTPQPGQHRGSGLDGADCHHLLPGDLIIIPAGTPHLLDARDSRFVYVVVKITEE